jgi:hypothetical protein
LSESLDWTGHRSSLQAGDLVYVNRPAHGYRFAYISDLALADTEVTDIGVVTDVRTTGDVRVLIGDSQVWTVVSRCTKVQGTST